MSKHSLIVGLSFGMTSGIITTLGLMVGLNAGTQSRLAVIGGILTIAIADAFSDALGIHVSEESENKHTPKEIWISTFSTFLSKFFFSITFIIPVLLLRLETAITVSIVWGLFALAIFSYVMAKGQSDNAFKVIGEHIGIAVLVMVVTHYAGIWIGRIFG